jgi:type VII secretion protein EccB
MQSRRDLVQAYKFSVSRMVSALTTGEPGKGQSPFRRAGLGLLAGTIIALAGCGALAVFGVIDPAASSSWRQQGAIIVEAGTGTRFVYLGGELHPVANYASALLAASTGAGTGAGTGGGAGSGVETVPAASLAQVPDGPALGIAGAPDTLPAATALLPARWALCLDPANPDATVVDLAPGAPAAVPPDDRLLVAGRRGDYVVWDNVKFPVRSKAVLVVLGFGDATPAPVTGAWLGALPTGPELASAAVPRAGEPGPSIAGAERLVGDLFVTSAGGVEQYYELRADGLAPISRTEFALREAVPGVSEPVELSPADVAAAPESADRSLLTSMPDMLGGDVYQSAGQALCVLHGALAGTSAPGTSAGAAALVTESAATVGQARLAGSSGAVVPAWGGMLAVSPQSSQASVTSLDSPSGPALRAGTQKEYLITDTGEKYPIADDQAASALGYGSVTAVTLPAQVLGLIPTGPVLSQAAAREAVTWPTS